MVGINARSGIEVLDEDGVIWSSSSPHDASLINIFDVSSLNGVPIKDDGEVGDVASILFKTFQTFDCIPLLVGANVTFQLLDCGSGASLDSFDADQVVGLLLSKQP